MNCNELLKEIQKRLVESGISDMITEFVREHPEYWAHDKYSTPASYNTSCNITVGFNTILDKDVNDMTQATPFYMLDIGRAQGRHVCMSIHPNNNSTWTDYWYGDEVQLSHRGYLNG